MCALVTPHTLAEAIHDEGECHARVQIVDDLAR